MVWGKAPQIASKRSAKGELKNSPVDCFLRGNALQVRAFPYSNYISQHIEMPEEILRAFFYIVVFIPPVGLPPICARKR